MTEDHNHCCCLRRRATQHQQTGTATLCHHPSHSPLSLSHFFRTTQFLRTSAPTRLTSDSLENPSSQAAIQHGHNFHSVLLNTTDRSESHGVYVVLSTSSYLVKTTVSDLSRLQNLTKLTIVDNWQRQFYGVPSGHSIMRGIELDYDAK